jgi:leader peptidase (prepilin peptidase)/N-methyltransferase
MELIDRIFADTTLFTLTVSILGLFIGSFLNVVIYRVPIAMERQWQHEARALFGGDLDDQAAPEDNSPFNIIVPGSHCPHCKTPIKPWHNIPILGYLLIGGKCAACKAPISLRYPAIELTTALLAGLIASLSGPSTPTLFFIVFAWLLLVLTMIDIDHQLLPDDLTLFLLWLGLGFNAMYGFTPLPDAVWGAIAGYLSLWSIYWVFKLVTGKEGMGYGDFKLLAALGAWLGWQALPLIIILSSFVGAVLGLAMIMIQGRDKAEPLPFGPYLAIAGLIALLWGDQITHNYLQLLG